MTRRVVIAGFGAIGKVIGRRLAEGMDGFTLAGVVGRDRAKTEREIEQTLARMVPVLSAEEVPQRADVLVECVPASVFRATVEPMVRGGGTVITVSSAAL